MTNIKKIAIAGQGGIGSWLSQLIFEYGFNRNQLPFVDLDITLFDSDLVDEKNLLHQNFSFEDLGNSKAKIIAERYGYKHRNAFMTVDDFKRYDLIFSCVDSMSFRKALYNYSWENPDLLWIDGRCNSRTCAVFHSRMKKEELEDYIDDSNSVGSCLLEYEKRNNISHVSPLIVAGLMMQTFLNLHRGEELYSHIFIG